MSSSVLFFYASHSVLVNSYIKMNLQHIVKWNYPPTAITGSSTQHKQACRTTHFIWNTHYWHSCPLKLKERNSFPQLLQLTLRFASEKPFPAITKQTRLGQAQSEDGVELRWQFYFYAKQRELFQKSTFIKYFLNVSGIPFSSATQLFISLNYFDVSPPWLFQSDSSAQAFPGCWQTAPFPRLYPSGMRETWAISLFQRCFI